MKQIAKYIALTTLLILIAPPLLYLADKMSLDTVKTVMLAATVLWFATAGLWIWPRQEEDATS